MSGKIKISDIYRGYFALLKKNLLNFIYIFILLITASVCMDWYVSIDDITGSSITSLLRHILLYSFIAFISFKLFESKEIHISIALKILAIILCINVFLFLIYTIHYSIHPLPVLALSAASAFTNVIGTIFIYKIVNWNNDSPINPLKLYFQDSSFFINITVILSLWIILAIPIGLVLRMFLDKLLVRRFLPTIGFIINLIFLPAVIFYLDNKKDSFVQKSPSKI